MKKTLLYVLLLALFPCLVSCTMVDNETTGNIYGIATIKETAEPLRATGVALYILEYDDDRGHHFSTSGLLLLQTVTYDDGHFEFNDLNPGRYRIKIEAFGYYTETKEIMVEQGRISHVDMQLEKTKTNITVYTKELIVSGNRISITGGYTADFVGPQYMANEAGFYYSTDQLNIINGIKYKAQLNNRSISGMTGSLYYGSFDAVIDNLPIGTYYIAAFAKNDYGIELGAVKTFEIVRGD